MTIITKEYFNSISKFLNLIPIGLNQYMISGCDLVIYYLKYDIHSEPIIEVRGRVPLNLADDIYDYVTMNGIDIKSLGGNIMHHSMVSFIHPNINNNQLLNRAQTEKIDIMELYKKEREYWSNYDYQNCYIPGYDIYSLEALKWFVETVRIYYMNNPIKVEDNQIK